jgi:hypothetical protein
MDKKLLFGVVNKELEADIKAEIVSREPDLEETEVERKLRQAQESIGVFNEQNTYKNIKAVK